VYEGNTQESCSIDRIDKLRQNGAEILEVYDGTEKEFFVINDKICVFHREKGWRPDLTDEEVVIEIESATKIPYQWIIVEEDNLYSQEIMRENIQTLSKEFNPPAILDFVIRRFDRTGEQISDSITWIEDTMQEHGLSCVWRVQAVLDEELDSRNCIDMCVDLHDKKDATMAYICFTSDFVIPDGITEELHKSINDYNKKPIFAEPVEGINGLLMNRIMHRKHTGNAFNVNIEDKLREFEDGIENFSYKITELCPSLKQ
jgi:hypothetical protein